MNAVYHKSQEKEKGNKVKEYINRLAMGNG